MTETDKLLVRIGTARDAISRKTEHTSLDYMIDGVLMNCSVLLKEQEEEHKRLLSWLSKFCRHIDNGDKWLTDEENLAFFKEKMKQQFDWDTD